MSKIGEITLKAAKDVSRGEKVTLDSLFSENEQKKEFETLAQVAPEETIRVKVSKLGDLETKAWYRLTNGSVHQRNQQDRYCISRTRHLPVNPVTSARANKDS